MEAFADAGGEGGSDNNRHLFVAALIFRIIVYRGMQWDLYAWKLSRKF